MIFKSSFEKSEYFTSSKMFFKTLLYNETIVLSIVFSVNSVSLITELITESWKLSNLYPVGQRYG